VDARVVLLLAFVGAYLLGSLPFGLWLARAIGKTDIRTAGSGNIGATNVTRVLGKKVGALTLFLDAGKGALAVFVGGVCGVQQSLWPTLLVSATAGACAVIGHCFPVWLRFRGGKGVATGLGMMIVVQWEAAVLAVLVFVLCYVATKRASVGSLCAAVAVVVYVLIRATLGSAMVPLFAALLVIVARHRENIVRLLKKSELSV
jgi:acyl phosphate:glycerol-3-phosphate acyltransferase